MKKFLTIPFVFFLLISVIGLVGCNGLWDFDDDDDVTAPPVVFTVKGAVAPPAGAVTNLRAVAAADLKAQAYNIKDEAIGSPVSVSGTAANLTYECKFSPKNAEDYYYVKIYATGFDMRVLLGTLKAADAAKPIEDAAKTTVNTESTAKAWVVKQELAANPTVAPKEPTAVTVEAALVTAIETGIKDPTKDIFTLTKITEIDPAATVAATGIAIANGAAASVAKEGSLTLTATLTPSYATDAVTWAITSGNDAGLIQLNTTTGVVTAVKVGGPVVITATAGNQTAQISITVTNLLPTGITLDKTTVSIGEGSTSQLTATIAPTTADDQTVTWKSSSDAVATVSNTGLVTAVKQGTATITATTVNGISVTCAVEVTPVINEVANVTFDAEVKGVLGAAFTIEITGFPTTFTTTATKVRFNNPDLNQILDVNVPKSDALSTSQKMVLGLTGTSYLAVGNEAFQTLTFTPAIPKGSTVKILNAGAVVATSNNIPAN